MKILYADAKDTWHKLMEKVLLPRGVNIIHAYSLKEVINKINSEKPEVAVLNVSLKNGKAYEIIPNVLSLGVPVILIGLKSEGFDEEKAKSMGVKFILPKPFTVDDLFRTINEAKLEKPKVETEEEPPAIVHSGGIKEPVKEEEEVVELSPVEEQPSVDEIEIEPVVTESSIIPKLEDESSEELIIEPEEETEGDNLIEIEPVSEEGNQLLIEEPSVEPEEKEMLAQAFGISGSDEKHDNISEIKEEPEVKQPEKVESVSQEIQPALSLAPEVKPEEKEKKASENVFSKEEKESYEKAVAFSSADIEKLKQEIKAEILKKLESEIREEIKAVIWEVIPDMAEKVIREEIEKFIKSRLV